MLQDFRSSHRFQLVYEEIHISPGAYLKEYRLQMACTMLRNTSETITTVSQNCGFHSASYFGKVFHSQMGCTPYEFKNKIGGGKYNEL